MDRFSLEYSLQENKYVCKQYVPNIKTMTTYYTNISSL